MSVPNTYVSDKEETSSRCCKGKFVINRLSKRKEAESDIGA